jgi:hypothetical protein
VPPAPRIQSRSAESTGSQNTHKKVAFRIAPLGARPAYTVCFWCRGIAATIIVFSMDLLSCSLNVQGIGVSNRDGVAPRWLAS